MSIIFCLFLKLVVFYIKIDSFVYFCLSSSTENMLRFITILIISFIFPFVSVGQNYPEVFFDNSLSTGSYAKSVVSYSGDSWVENVSKNLLVSDTLFFTPGNSLSLKYISAPGGNWNVRINYSKQKTQYRWSSSDQLSFFIYVNTKNAKASNLPKVFVKQKDGLGDTISMEKYISGYAVNSWLHVVIPAQAFAKIQKESIISAIGFAQNKPSEVLTHLFIDQIEFLPAKSAAARMTSPAILTEVVPYDKMVHLKWQTPLSPGIRYVKVYRSTDGKNFDPVAIRPIHMQSALDVVPLVGKKYYYKIVWLDNNYKESPASQVKEAETKSLTDSSLVELVQAAHINYFVENFDVNSGMYMPFRSKDKAIVSTKETAGAILALIVGAEKKQVSRQMVLQRISKIAYFLMKAQSRYGIFPAHFDGRKGLPEYRRGAASYDVQASASLIEALLVAREYFDGDGENERDLRSRITALYDQINWAAISNSQSLLNSKFALVNSDADLAKSLNEPISGANEGINTYLMAVSSKRNPLPAKAYFDGVYSHYGVQKAGYIEELDMYEDSLANYGIPNMVNINFVQDTVSKVSILKPTLKYGLNLPFGEYTGSLMDLYKPFMTVKPSLIQDSLSNWEDVLKAYTYYVKRRDNELGVGVKDGDVWGFYQHQDSVGNYRINPAIGPSSIVADRQVGEAALLTLFKGYGDVLFTEYGFRSWLDVRNNDESDEYLAMNQSALPVLIENMKTGLIWNLYERIPELKEGRKKLFSRPASLVD